MHQNLNLFNKLVAIILTIILQTSCSSDTGNTQDKTPPPSPPILSISPPILSIEDTYTGFGQIRDVLIDNEIVYVASGTSGLDVLKITSGKKLEKIGSLRLLGDGRAYSLEKNNNILYMASRSEGIYVIDVTEPTNPLIVTTLLTPAKASFLHIANNTLYVSATNYFLIFDVSTPSKPKLLSSELQSSPNQRMLVEGNYAYVAAYEKGIRIIDVSNPILPKTVAEKSVGSNIRSVSKNGDLLFIGGNDERLFSINVSKPSNPVTADELTLPNTSQTEQYDQISYDITGWKEFLLIANGGMGVQLVDASTPSAPTIKSGINTTGNSWGLALNNNTLIVADYLNVQLINIFETTDIDDDGVLDGADVFPRDPTEWEDTDNDGIGNNSDLDDDNDTYDDTVDAFPLDPNEWLDTDGDLVGDNSDAFVTDNTEWLDSDLDGIGDNADQDDDNDGIIDINDSYPNDQYNTIRITENGRSNGFPKLDGNHIAWRGYTSSGVSTIYYENLTTGTRVDVGSTATVRGFTGIPSLSNGQVAWRVWDDATDRLYIYLWDGAQTRLITDYPVGNFPMPWGYLPSYHSVDVALDNGQIAWAGWDGNDYEIYLWDGANTTQITDNSVNDYEAQLNNGQIAWTGVEANSTSFDVFFWDGLTITNVSNRPGYPDEDAHLMNGEIAWSGYNKFETKRDIYLWDGNTTKVVSPLVKQDFEPQINNSNDFITWNNTDNIDYNIFVWDGYETSQLDIPTAYKLKSPFANNGRIAYARDSADGADIYISEFRIDKDEDGYINSIDQFPLDITEWEDSDNDGIGNNGDTDDDNDGVLDTVDLFPLDPTEWADRDGDNVGDNADIFPSDPNESNDSDLDGIGDNADKVNQLTLTSVSLLTDTNTFTGQARGVLIEDGIAYVAEGTSGLGFYTIESDGKFTEQPLRRYNTPVCTDLECTDRSARTFAKIGDFIYLAKRHDGLLVLDISNPDETTLVTAIPTPTFPEKTKSKATFITVDNNIMYVSIRDGVMIFDISTPGNPVLLKSYETTSEFEHILVEDGIAYIAAYYSGIILLDVTDPSEPIKIAQQAVPNTGALPGESQIYAMWAVEKQGNYMFTAGESSGLHVFDVSNPLQPLHVANISLPSSANPLTILDQPPFHMEAVGNNLFIADGSTGIQVVDISDPLNPSIIAEHQISAGESHDFYIKDYTMIIGNYRGGGSAELVNLGTNLDHDGDGTPNYLDNFPLDSSQI